ncbi:MAG: hypothetical protein EBU90_13815 [Proteobacteria bacterium]|nr:hypothetical protein [Pseudomonadota bacterium]NBP13580.1 hypothetical protein [bacterium]
MIEQAMSASVVTLFVVLFVVYWRQSTECDNNFTKLQKKYDDDTKPLKFQVSDLKTKIFELTQDKDQLKKDIDGRDTRIKKLEQNVYGKFDKSYIVSDKERSCVTISDNTKGDYSILQLNVTCKNPEKIDIFSYDPVYKQLQIAMGSSVKCVDSMNENDVVVSDCIKTAQKQKFNYFPLYDGRFKSMLYNKCLGYNLDNNIIELQKCGEITNIRTPKELQNKHLFLENNI